MKERRKFYKKMIVFHLVLYPLATWLLVWISVDRVAQNFIIGLFAIGMLVSMTNSCILPLVRLRKEEKVNESKRIMREVTE
jgi:diacylglycerol kinase